MPLNKVTKSKPNLSAPDTSDVIYFGEKQIIETMITETYVNDSVGASISHEGFMMFAIGFGNLLENLFLFF